MHYNVPELGEAGPDLVDAVLNFTRCVPQNLLRIQSIMQSPENRFRPIEELVVQYKAINKEIGPVRAAIEYIKEKNPFAFEILQTLVWLNPCGIHF